MSALTHTPEFTYSQPRVSIRQRSSFGRLIATFLQWRQRRVEQDIAIHLGLSGGHITDEIERRMNERLIGRGGFRG